MKYVKALLTESQCPKSDSICATAAIIPAIACISIKTQFNKKFKKYFQKIIIALIYI